MLKAIVLKVKLFLARMQAGVTTEAIKNTAKIVNPTLGFLKRGYKIIGEIQKSCISTAKYHKCPIHICEKLNRFANV